jgi:predicted nuclease with TOPRIM domain
MHITERAVLFCVLLAAFLFPGKDCTAQRASQANVQLGQPVDEMLLLKERVADQIYLYKEVMEHIREISEKFSDGYMEPDEALKKVTVLRHAYNTQSEPVPAEASELKKLMNQMFSRLENYLIHFKRVYRENPYLNAKVAETKFYASQEAERLEYVYLR